MAGIHHVEIWVTELATARVEWGWIRTPADRTITRAGSRTPPASRPSSSRTIPDDRIERSLALQPTDS